MLNDLLAYVVIHKLEEKEKDEVFIEDCGLSTPRLTGYAMFIDLEYYEDILDLIKDNDATMYNQLIKLDRSPETLKLITDTLSRSNEVRLTSLVYNQWEGNIDLILKEFKYVGGDNNDYINSEQQVDIEGNYNSESVSGEDNDTFTEEELLEIIEILKEIAPSEVDVISKTAWEFMRDGNPQMASALVYTVVEKITGK